MPYDFHRSDILFKRLQVLLFEDFLENGHDKKPCNGLGSTMKYSAKTGSLSEFSQGILEKLKGNSIINRRIMTLKNCIDVNILLAY